MRNSYFQWVELPGNRNIGTTGGLGHDLKRPMVAEVAQTFGLFRQQTQDCRNSTRSIDLVVNPKTVISRRALAPVLWNTTGR